MVSHISAASRCMASLDLVPLRRVSEASRVGGRFARAAPVRRSRVVSVRAEGVPLPRSGETSEEMNARRMKETVAVENRTTYVTSKEEFDAFLSEADDKLVFLSVINGEECDLGDYPDAQDVQRSVSDDAQNPCVKISNTLTRVARECSDAVFLTLEADSSPEMMSLAGELGVTRFPTFQYYKSQELVWENVGASSTTTKAIGEGMLYYGGQAAGGLQANEYITEIKSQDDLQDFLDMCAAPQESPLGVELDVACEKQLAILDISTAKDSPACIKIYPAVLALAKNTAGACRWARMLSDSGDTATEIMKEFNVTSVPTFLFFNEGKEVGRYTGSDRLELMNKVIQIQKDEGFRLPDRKPRKRIPVAEAKRIAQEARAKQKASQWTQ